MNKKTETKLKEILTELTEIAIKEKCSINVYAKNNGHCSAFNEYWELSKRKGFDFFTDDRGKTWINLF
jgi:hypothetical protein